MSVDYGATICGALPLPVWGEGATELSRGLNPSPHPSPSRSRIYPTSANLMRRTRVNPSSVGEGADRVCRQLWSSIMIPAVVNLLRYHPARDPDRRATLLCNQNQP